MLWLSLGELAEDTVIYCKIQCILLCLLCYHPPAVRNWTSPSSLYPSYKSLRSFCHSDYGCNTSKRAGSQYREFSPEHITHLDGKGFLAVPTLEPTYSTAVTSHTLSELLPCTHLHLFCVLPMKPPSLSTELPSLCFHADTASAVHPFCPLVWEYGAAAAAAEDEVPGPLLPCWSVTYDTHCSFPPTYSNPDIFSPGYLQTW